MEAHSDLRILIVEDDDDTADCMAMVLRMHGHDVAVARDGPTALQMADANAPDVVLLDIAMPKMDGWRLAKELRCHTERKRPLLIAISGYGAPSDKSHSQEVGIDVHLIKPVKAGVLEELLAGYHATADEPGRLSSLAQGCCIASSPLTLRSQGAEGALYRGMPLEV
jgi:CheY-like chemotaxis protein